MKADGYDTQPYERKEVSLFNCIVPEWVDIQKRLISPAMSISAIVLHQDLIIKHTQIKIDRIAAVKDLRTCRSSVRNFQPCSIHMGLTSDL